MLSPDAADPWPEGNASLLLHFVPLPFFTRSGCASCAGGCRLHPLILQGPWLRWGFEAEACSLGPPPCTAAIPHPMQQRCFYRRAKFSAGLVLREGDNPALRSTVILAREISGSTRSSSPPVAPCHRFKPCKLFLTVNKTSQEPTWKTGFPQTPRPLLFPPRPALGIQ